jgi:hypothetical protein
MTIEIKKGLSSRRQYGRGPDNNYTPAHYDIIKNGVRVGIIMSQTLRYGDRAVWDIVGMDWKPIKTFYPGSRQGTPFKRAKQFALDHFNNS